MSCSTSPNSLFIAFLSLNTILYYYISSNPWMVEHKQFYKQKFADVFYDPLKAYVIIPAVPHTPT